MSEATDAEVDFMSAAQLNQSGTVVRCPATQSELSEDVMTYLRPLGYRFCVRRPQTVS